MCGEWMSGTAISASTMTRKPASPATASARMIAGGACRRGSCVSSASDPAVSNPYRTYALVSAATRRAPK